MTDIQLDIASLQTAYHSGEKPSTVIASVYDRVVASDLNPVWISLVPRDDVLQRAKQLDALGATPAALSGRADDVQHWDLLPLYGIPFAVKDNIDVAGMETTAGCPAFAYRPDATATVVKRLEDAGAILIGKTNLEQFATGLVGVRSPYGACSSVFDDRYISGGSSSGSAVAVASGLVTFSLGTDTAGSGRVPAAFNNIVGLKPTRGFLSTLGVVPACRSLDCVSIFTLTCRDGWQVFQVARGFDQSDPYSRQEASEDAPAPWLVGGLRVGVPQKKQWEFFGDSEAEQVYVDAIRALESLARSSARPTLKDRPDAANPWKGGEASGIHAEATADSETLSTTIIEFDYQPFLDAAALLYSGPWVAERLAALRPFFDSHAHDVHPIVRQIIAGAAKHSAVDAFLGEYRLEELRRKVEETWNKVDVLLLPTTGTIYTREAVEADPIALNTNLGRYTNFVNLLDLAAVAIPAGFRANGLPFGVTLIGRAGTDVALMSLADRLHRRLVDSVGGPSRLAQFPGDGKNETSASHTPSPFQGEGWGEVSYRLDQTPPMPDYATPPGCILLAVVGAHLTGQPLNHQLVERGARLICTTKTAVGYRLYALPETTPPKPGLVREPSFAVDGIEVEVWAMPQNAFGSFVAAVPSPLGIGSVELADGSTVKGFICEPYAVAGAVEITQHGGWRGYLASR